LLSSFSRLLPWDRSGVISTEPFDWRNQPDTLFEFFWAAQLPLGCSDAVRGYDTAVTSVEVAEAEAALSKLKRFQGLEKVQPTDLHKFLVRDNCGIDGQLGTALHQVQYGIPMHFSGVPLLVTLPMTSQAPN
jgi:hypothetical protein